MQAALGLSPYIIVKGADAAIAFYSNVFDATEEFRLSGPGGEIGHAELTIGNGRLMLADESPSFGALSPPTIGGSPVSLHLYVDDVDATVARASRAGATVLRPPKDEFYGDRTSMIADPFGHRWHLATRKEAVSPQEMQSRYDAIFAGEN